VEYPYYYFVAGVEKEMKSIAQINNEIYGKGDEPLLINILFGDKTQKEKSNNGMYQALIEAFRDPKEHYGGQ
jgi:hypothetical protein